MRCATGFAGAWPSGRMPKVSNEAVRAYFDRMASGWDENSRHSPEKLRRMLNFAGITPGDRILDEAVA